MPCLNGVGTLVYSVGERNCQLKTSKGDAKNEVVLYL